MGDIISTAPLSFDTIDTLMGSVVIGMRVVRERGALNTIRGVFKCDIEA